MTSCLVLSWTARSEVVYGTAMIIDPAGRFILSPQFKCFESSYLHFSLHHLIYGYSTNSQGDQLLHGLIAQFLDHFIGITEFIGLNPVQAWIFFKVLISQLLNAYSCDDHWYVHIFLYSSNIWCFLYSLGFFTIYGYISNSKADQLPAGLIAQLVEHCTTQSEHEKG